MTNAQIFPRTDENIDDFMRRFKKAVQRSGLPRDLQKHEAFESRGQRKRRKRGSAQARRIGGLSKVKMRPDGPEYD